MEELCVCIQREGKGRSVFFVDNVEKTAHKLKKMLTRGEPKVKIRQLNCIPQYTASHMLA